MSNIFRNFLKLDRKNIYLSVILRDVMIDLSKFEKLCSRITKSIGASNTLEVLIRSDESYNDEVNEISEKLGVKLTLIKENNNFNNTALTQCKGKWLTFTNLSVTHSLQLFVEFKKLADNTKTLCIVPKTIYKRKGDGASIARHPLAYIFKKSKTVKLARLLSDHILLTEEHCFLNADLIKKSKLKFSEGYEFKFDNPKFINSLVDNHGNHNVIFCGNVSIAKVVQASHNVLHEGNDNILNWTLEYLKELPLEIIEDSKVNGKVPTHIQCLMIYEVFRRISFFLNRQDRFSLLSRAEQDQFIQACKGIMNHVEERYINSYLFNGFVEEHKVAFLSLFKNSKRPVSSVYVNDVASRSGKAQFFYVSGGQEYPLSVDARVNGKLVQQDSISHTRTFLFDNIYCVKNLFWIDFKDHDFVSFMRDGVDANVKNGGKSLGKLVNWLDIRNSQIRSKPADLTKDEESLRAIVQSSFPQWCNSWLIVDRPDKADDNSEHFYRYIKDNELHDEIYFALSKGASDWKRLEEEGFNLIDYGSEEHLICLANCRFLISSQAGHGLFHPKSTKSFSDLVRYRFIFLQHGVIMTDISKWLNNVRMKKFVTSTPGEYNFIAGTEGNYKFSDTEVCLTGMPRHDSLLKNKDRVHPDTILIMPTWRKYLTLDPKEIGGAREPLPNFLETDYAKNWIKLLSDEKLKVMVEESGFKLKFAMHPNLAMYVNEFKIPSYIEIIDVTDDFSYSEQILETVVLITDYSSVAFDAAVIDRPVIYFQFDKEDFSSGKHTSVEGYFDFEDDGFGPVSYQSAQVLDALQNFLIEGESLIYQERRDKTYPKRDGNSCERVYKEIRSLDE